MGRNLDYGEPLIGFKVGGIILSEECLAKIDRCVKNGLKEVKSKKLVRKVLQLGEGMWSESGWL